MSAPAPAPTSTLTDRDRQVVGLTALLELERAARRVRSLGELTFLMANRTLAVLPAAQAGVWRRVGRREVRLERISAAGALDRTAPFVGWLEGVLQRVCSELRRRQGDGVARACPIEAATLDDARLAEAWASLVPAHGLVCPLVWEGRLFGGLWFVRAEAWSEADRTLAERLAETYAHAWATLAGHAPRPARPGRGWLWGPLMLVGLAGMLSLPVTQSVLAPAEIVPREPFVVTAPADGVVEAVLVAPNQAVAQGAPLFRLDDTRLRSQYEVAVKGLQVAEAEFHKAQQLAFGDAESQAALAVLRARIALRSAEAAYARNLLERIEVRAERAGIALFEDANDWRGRPVVTGQRVMTLADPTQVAVGIDLPADDAIDLAPGAPVRVFLNVAPLDSLSASLTRMSYEAQPTAAGVLAYRLIARLDEAAETATGNTDGGQEPPRAARELPRIGLKGTAEIKGGPTILAFYLFRRPLTVLRRWIGW